MYRVTVLYRHPQDPEAFERYYRQTHLPLAVKMPGLAGFTVGKLDSLNPAERPSYYRIASLYAESAEAAHAILASSEGQATVADIQNFATGGVTIVADDEEVLIPVQLAAKASAH